MENYHYYYYLLCTNDKRIAFFSHLRFDMFDESSGIVLHCCDNLCEYNFIRSFNSCGSKLCESMAATSMILLCVRVCIQNEWKEMYNTKKKKMMIIDFTVENDAHIFYSNGYHSDLRCKILNYSIKCIQFVFLWQRILIFSQKITIVCYHCWTITDWIW